MKVRIIEIDAAGDELHAALEQFQRVLAPAPPPMPPKSVPSALLAPKAKATAKTPTSAIDWEKYDIRTASRELHPCAVCKEQIRQGDRYRDGNYEGRRAHVLCVASAA